MVSTEVVIIGGGLAGLTAGIYLSQNGISVTNIEKNEYPKHMVLLQLAGATISSGSAKVLPRPQPSWPAPPF